MASLLRFALLLTTMYIAKGSHFRGVYVTWTVNQTDHTTYPANAYSNTAKIHLQYGISWRRSDGSSHCTNSSISNCQYFHHGQYTIQYGTDGRSFPYSAPPVTAGFYCERFSSSHDFTIGSNIHTIYLDKNYVYRIQSSSCCWVYGMHSYSSSSWNIQAIISLKRRNASLPNAYRINTPPQIGFLPSIQQRQYASGTYDLPVSDPDGDDVQCRYASNFTEGGGVYASRIPGMELHKNCTIEFSYPYYSGWYALAIMVEDFAFKYSNSQWERQSSVPLQIMVNIYGSSGVTIYGENSTQCAKNGSSPVIKVNYPSSSSLMSASPAVSASTSSSMMISSMSPTVPLSKSLDGCKYYQVLSDPSRMVTYNDWSSYRCDKEVYGWYRFMGAAGNRMMNSCPFSLGGNRYRCGSYYQGWIPNGALPSTSEGVVARSVCFSPYYSCTCSSSRSILIKNCGTFHVYWLNSVPYCNSRYCGVKDKSSVVSCTSNYMRIDLDRAFYDTSQYSSITLRDTSCKASFTSTHVTLGSVPGACGSTRSETSTHIVYENEVIFKGTTHGTITRDPEQRVKFKCLLDKNGKLSTYRYLPISNVTGSEVGYGNFTFNFVMYTDHTYSRMHSHYPVSVKLRDWMYFEIYASATDSNTIILIDQCFSTPNMDINHYLKYVFINNRCPADPTVQFHSGHNNRQRFSIQAFRFLNASTAVYLHCLVFLCHSTSSDYRCQSGCAGNNIHRGKRDVDRSADEPSKYYLIEREIRRADDKGQGTTPEKQSGNVAGMVGMGVAVVALVAAVAGLAFKVKHMKKSAKVRPGADKGNRYTSNEESRPPEHAVKEDPLCDAAEMQNVGIINKAQQADIFKDNAFCS